MRSNPRTAPVPIKSKSNRSRQDHLFPTQEEIVAALDEVIYGQDRAKAIVALAVVHHFLAKAHAEWDSEAPSPQPQHVLIGGPTGTGKSLLAQTLARFLEVPFLAREATNLVKTGYVGKPVDSLIFELVEQCGGDISLAERGIIFIDEIDKIRAANPAWGVDVSGSGVQQNMLTFLEKRLVRTEHGTIDTSGILFICAGAFEDCQEIEDEAPKIGFLAERSRPKPSSGYPKLTRRRLIEYGFLPEFVGRFPRLTQTEPLSKRDLERLLTEVKNSPLERKVSFWALHGIELEITPSGIRAIAEEAAEEGVGARGLGAVLDRAFERLDTQVSRLAEENVVRVVLDGKSLFEGAAPEVTRGLRLQESLLAKLRRIAGSLLSKPAKSPQQDQETWLLNEARRLEEGRRLKA